MKKFIAACALIGVMCFSSSALAAEEISIEVKNKKLQTDNAPVIVQGRVLVPLRAVSESLGASVEWKQQQKTAIVTKWSKRASLTIGKKTALVENSAAGETFDVPLDVTVRTIDNRVYVPLRFISQQLGYKVDYKNNTVTIKSPLSENYFAKLYSGDLSTSRQIAISINGPYGDRNFEHPPLQTLHPYHDHSMAFLFPEGEALRFFTIEGNETVTFFEHKDDFLVATWQAHLQDIEGNAIQQLFADQLKDRTGPAPKIKKPFLYYYYVPYGNTVHRSGRIDVDGKYTETGYKSVNGDVTDSFGTISLVLPNEIRQENVTTSKN